MLSIIKAFFRKDVPDYIRFRGFTYERITVDAANIDVDLDEDVSQMLEETLAQGGYVNIQEIIRAALRNAIRSGQTIDGGIEVPLETDLTE